MGGAMIGMSRPVSGHPADADRALMGGNIVGAQRFRDIVVVGMLLALQSAATWVTPVHPHHFVSRSAP
jgi:hypothetical protein